MDGPDGLRPPEPPNTGRAADVCLKTEEAVRSKVFMIAVYNIVGSGVYTPSNLII